jgi:hypothetical protein
MGYRGSKSATGLIPTSQTKPGAVKEQRVDGSWCINPVPQNKKLMHLRYTLMGFERNYQVKIPSNQMFTTRQYSMNKITHLSAVNNYTSCSKSNFINPFFITGFTDGEGCF